MINDPQASKKRQKFYAEIAARSGSYEYYCQCGNRRVFAHHPVGPVVWHDKGCLETFPVK